MSGRTGFSVVELLVSTVIFSFGVLSGIALLGTGYRWEGQSQLATQLTVAAEMKVEELRALAGTDRAETVELGVGGDLDANLYRHWDTVELDGRVFERRWLVEIGPAGTRRVTVQSRPVVPPSPARAQLWTYVIHD